MKSKIYALIASAALLFAFVCTRGAHLIEYDDLTEFENTFKYDSGYELAKGVDKAEGCLSLTSEGFVIDFLLPNTAFGAILNAITKGSSAKYTVFLFSEEKGKTFKKTFDVKESNEDFEQFSGVRSYDGDFIHECGGEVKR